MTVGWALRIDGSPYVFTTPDVPAITGWGGDDVPADVAIAAGVLEPPTGALSERMRPVDGELEVTNLAFVLHDLPLGTATYGIADLFSRDINDGSATYLTASVSLSATTIDVASAAALGSLPTKVWIGAEAIRVNSVVWMTQTVNVTRAMYGTRAQVHTLDDSRGSRPEVFTRVPWVTRRRVTLYRVEDGVATVWWTGHADHAPRRASAPHTASWTLSCTHAWTREKAAVLGVPEPVGFIDGFDSRLVRLAVRYDGGAGLVGSVEADRKSHVYRDLRGAAQHAADRLAANLLAGGGTTVSAHAVIAPEGLQIHVTAASLGDWKLEGRIVGIEGASAEVDARNVGGTRQATLVIPYRAQGALALVARDPSGSGNPSQVRYTGFRRGVRCPTDWTAVSAQGCTLTPVALIPMGEDQVLELIPQSASPVSLSDGTRFDPAMASFASRGGNPVVIPADPLADPPAPGADNSWGLAVDRPLPMRLAWRVEGPHWASAIRAVIESSSLGGMPDTRSWSWSTLPRLTQEVDTWTSVLWRLDGTQVLGDYVSSAAKLFGCGVGVRAGKLALVAIRQATATETVAATITAADLRAGELPHWEFVEDGLVTHAAFETPRTKITVNDVVAQERFGQGRAIDLRAVGFRAAEGASLDPLTFARQIAQRLLRLYSDPVYLVKVPLDAGFASIYLGDIVAVSAFNAPDGAGSLGLFARGVVIGRTYDFASGGVDLEVLFFPLASGYAPCARVSAISGGSTVLELAASYAGAAGDYAGSGLDGYEKTAADRGAGWFAAPYAVRLIERDSESPLTEAATVASVNTAARTITLTAALVGGWAAILAAGGIVDVELAPYASATAEEKKFAYVGDDADRLIINTDRSKRWSA